MPRERDATIQELESGVLIDERRLEEACSQHPDFFYRVAKRLAYETSLRDAAKETLANKEAAADARIRLEAERAEEKITEREVDSKKRLDPQVEAVRKQYNDLIYSVAQWTALKDAFLQRSYMLKTLAELYVSNYYSDTSTGRTQVAGATADRAKRELQQERIRRKT